MNISAAQISILRFKNLRRLSDFIIKKMWTNFSGSFLADAMFTKKEQVLWLKLVGDLVLTAA